MAYSFYPNLTNKRDLRPATSDISGTIRNISFSEKQPNTILILKNTNHFLQGFSNFSAVTAFGGIAQNIPLLCGNFQEFRNKGCYDLFMNWNAEIRYAVKNPSNSNPLDLSYAKVSAFFKIANTIYEWAVQYS